MEELNWAKLSIWQETCVYYHIIVNPAEKKLIYTLKKKGISMLGNRGAGPSSASGRDRSPTASNSSPIQALIPHRRREARRQRVGHRQAESNSDGGACGRRAPGRRGTRLRKWNTRESWAY